MAKHKVFYSAVLGLTLLSQSAVGQNSVALQTRDLWFLPNAGQFFSNTEASYTRTHFKVDFPGAPSATHTAFALGEIFGYSITDSFQVFAGAAFASDKETDSSTPGTEDSASGIKDPVVGFNYRILRSDESPVLLDFLFSLSPSLGTATGNNVYRGSSEFEARFNVGQNVGSFEYAGYLAASYFTRQKEDTDTYKPRFDFTLGGEIQYDFNELISINSGAEIVIPGEYEDDTTGLDVENRYALGISAGPEFQILENLSAGLTVSLNHMKSQIVNVLVFDINTNTYSLVANLDFVF